MPRTTSGLPPTIAGDPPSLTKIKIDCSIWCYMRKSISRLVARRTLLGASGVPSVIKARAFRAVHCGVLATQPRGLAETPRRCHAMRSCSAAISQASHSPHATRQQPVPILGPRASVRAGTRARRPSSSDLADGRRSVTLIQACGTMAHDTRSPGKVEARLVLSRAHFPLAAPKGCCHAASRAPSTHDQCSTLNPLDTATKPPSATHPSPSLSV